VTRLCLPVALVDAPGRFRGLFADDLDDHLAFAGAGVALEEQELLPGAEREGAVDDRYRHRGAQERGADVARAVVVAPALVMPVLAVARGKPLENGVEVRHRARLELDRRHGGRGADDEDGGRALPDARVGDGAGGGRGQVVRVALPVRLHRLFEGPDHVC
jgi:hypothetical protein